MSGLAIEGKMLERMLKENSEFKRLFDEHHDLEKTLAKLNKAPHLSPAKEAEKKEMQKRKLAGKDRMMELLKQEGNDISH